MSELFKLYPYQEKAVDYAVSMLFERKNSLIVAATGAGKTIMMAAAIGRFFKGFIVQNSRKPHVLVLVHRTEIHAQNHSKFSKVCPEIGTSEITAMKKSLRGNVHFGMVQTVAGLLDEFEKADSFFDLIVYDEAHHAAASTYENIYNWNFAQNKNTCLLGVTATPNRGDKLPLSHLFDNFYQITIKFLIDSHYLVRPKFIDLSPTFTIEKPKKTYEEKGHLAKNCRDDEAGNALILKLCDDYLAHKEPGKSVIFAPSHEFCRRIYDILKIKGRNPAYVSADLSSGEREAELEKFSTGDCPMKGEAEELINVDICTEGYDYPPLRNVVDFDTNGTPGQWIQKVGRVLRTAPGKTTCTVIDFGGNIDLYPDGVETDVNLDGEYTAPKGEKLTENDFFKKQKKYEEKETAAYITEKSIYTPYHPPKGFETVSDPDFGIVFVACGQKKDCIIVGGNDDFSVFLGDKKNLNYADCGSFGKCAWIGLDFIGEIEVIDKPISNLQIKLLAPDFPTAAMTYSGANCAICWKTWKSEVNRHYVKKT